MASRIEDYALIGDCRTGALVSRTGSIDWLCLPHFDSPACFAALLGTPENGHWQIAPAGEIRHVRRRYREGTLILETDFECDGGTVTLVDFMTPDNETPDVLRTVIGRKGRVAMRTEFVARFDYGSIVPWVRHTSQGISLIGGPDMLSLRTSIPIRGEDLKTVADFTISEGDSVTFDLTWYPSNRIEPELLDAGEALAGAEQWWRAWSDRCSYRGPWEAAVRRSLITLKALTFAPTGGIVAAPTTSLPELIGGVRNWDYRFCWVRDATLTLYSLVNAGYLDEAREWRDWLLRAVAGNPGELNILYGLHGERRLTELELPWLTGYEGSRPVHTGNAAYSQFQLDIYGEIADTLYLCREAGMEGSEDAAPGVGRALLEHLASVWEKPDEGIWEVRGPRRHFTHSKMMAWVALDRAVKSVEQGWLSGPVEEWRELRDRVHAQVCREGFDEELGAFVQFYGSKNLDASLLMMPLVGFLPANDARVRGTVAAIEKGLMSGDGFVYRYTRDAEVDGLPHGEGAFLPCTFWLADNYALQGRCDEALRIFERLLAIQNDVGLLSEEYDPAANRLLGNFPQAFSHVALVNTAARITRALEGKPATRSVAGQEPHIQEK